MRVHSPQIIKNIVDLRRKGLSLSQIVTKLSVPKTTVWHYIKGIQLKPKLKLLLRAQQGGSLKRKLANIEASRIRAKQILQSDKREMAIAAAMIYWAEGTKGECEFINSDGKMVQLYLNALRNIFNVPEEYIKPTMRFFTGMDKDKCLAYWAKITNIKEESFIIRYNDGGTKCRTEFGMCRITVRKGANILKLLVSLREIYFNEMNLN